MPYTVEYDTEAGLITSHLQGVIDLEAMKAFAQALVKAVKEYDCRLLLNDYREVTLAISTMDIYDFPETVAKLLAAEGIETYKVKRALVVSTDLSDFTFFENVSRNRAHNVKLFRDIEQARAWLLANRFPNNHV